MHRCRKPSLYLYLYLSLAVPLSVSGPPLDVAVEGPRRRRVVHRRVR